MKQQTNESQKFNDFNLEENNLIPRIVICIFILILNICVYTVKGQVNAEVGVEMVSSGNAHGAFYSIYGGITKNSNSLLLGGLVQKSGMQMSGFKLMYSKNLTGSQYLRFSDGRQGFDADPVQLNFYAYAQYIHNTKLCAAEVAFERATQTDNFVRWEEVKLNTVETGSGIELRINFSNHLAWRNTVGAAVYYHGNYLVPMSHEKIGPSLNLSTGLNFQF